MCAILVSAWPHVARAEGGPFGIDHRLEYDDSGIWKRRNQLLVQDAAALVIIAGALWEGDQTRLGHTYWQSIDSVALGTASVAILKLIFSRARPAQSNNPNDWFQGHGHKSFPSGEVAAVASAVTPFVLEYGAEHPAVYALELLPAYVAVGRVKVQAHWQSDVLAAFALGTAVGYYAHGRSSSLSVGILPGSVTIGWRTKF
jgi:undecaprenyl-diphosphatase